jgi:hypothetical protein
MKLAHCGLAIALAACVPGAGATARAGQSQSGHGSQTAQSATSQNEQKQTDPLAAAARRARQKEKDEPQPSQVWDNDNIPKSGDVDIVGPAAQGSSGASASGTEANGNAAKTPASSSTSKSDLEAQLKAARENLKNLQTQLDFARRKLALDQEDFYRNPNYASDDAGARKLKSEQSQIDAKKQQVTDAQKKVDELAAKLKAAGGKK